MTRADNPRDRGGPPRAATPSGATSDDAVLVERIRAGDEAAFRAIVDAYHGRLVRTARAFVADASAAEEVAQETWMAVLSGIDRFEGRSSLKTWVFRILINRAKTRGVRDARSVPFSALGDEGASADGPAVDPDRFDPAGMWALPPRRWDDDTPERVALIEEARAHMERAVEALPPRQRMVLVLRDVEGLEAEEVCNMMEIAETNQRVLLHRARSAVHRALERYLAED